MLFQSLLKKVAGPLKKVVIPLKKRNFLYSPDLRVLSTPAFLEVLHSDGCLNFQIARLRAAKDTLVISFSIDTDAATVFFQGNVPYAQIEESISTEKQVYKSVVQDWLGHIDIVNLKLTAC